MDDLPQSITKIADDHGVSRAVVTTLIIEHGIPTYRIPPSTVVKPGDWPRLARLLEVYCERKGRRVPASSK